MKKWVFVVVLALAFLLLVLGRPNVKEHYTAPSYSYALSPADVQETRDENESNKWVAWLKSTTNAAGWFTNASWSTIAQYADYTYIFGANGGLTQLAALTGPNQAPTLSQFTTLFASQLASVPSAIAGQPLIGSGLEAQEAAALQAQYPAGTAASPTIVWAVWQWYIGNIPPAASPYTPPPPAPPAPTPCPTPPATCPFTVFNGPMPPTS